VERQIDDKYIKTGIVRLGYAHYSFLGPESNWAAEASECADDQGAFWNYHDKLFASQAGENKGAFNKDKLKQFAADLKLNTATFNACLDSGKYTPTVTADTVSFQSFGVQSTPTFVINGRPVSGGMPFEGFQQYIEAARTKKK
jgi:protein-disulfide isomerase